jgi:hypothetical protein
MPKMYVYKNTEGNSGVSSYMIGKDYIIIRFVRSDKAYKYSYDKAGEEHVEYMKKLARAGKGLSTYISRHVHGLYD